jgi:hypothetical protein
VRPILLAEDRAADGEAKAALAECEGLIAELPPPASIPAEAAAIEV